MAENGESLKMKILQLEKRFVELELAVTELKEQTKAGSPEFEERVGDIEDLIMVEQAGILELKKMMEGAQTQISAALKEKIPEGLNERLEKIDKEIAEIENIAKPTETEMQAIHDGLRGLKKDLGFLSVDIYDKIREVQTKVNSFEGRPSSSPIDFDLITSKIDSLKRTVEDVSEKRMELDMKLGEVDKKFQLLESRVSGSMSQAIEEEVRSAKKDVFASNVRLDSVERVVKNLILETEELNKKGQSFESIEKLSMLKNDVEDKLGRFKMAEDELRRLSSKMELIYDNVDKRLRNIHYLEKVVPELSDSISKLAKEVDRNRVEILSRAKREDLEQGISSEERAVGSKMIVMNERIGMIEEDMKKIVKVGSEIASVESLMESVTDLNFKIRNLEDKISALQVPSALNVPLNELLEKIVYLEGKMNALNKNLGDLARARPVIVE